MRISYLLEYPSARMAGMALHMDGDEFGDLVDEVFDDLDPRVLDQLENVAFVIEDRPDDGSLGLLGLYHGVPNPARGEYGFGELPDRIVLYREPLLSRCDTTAELRRQVRITLMHEIGHYFGLGDARLRELGWG